MKSIAVKELSTHAWRYRWLIASLATIALGLYVGTSWFVRNLGLSPYGRGLMCCDAARYLWLSSAALGDLIYHVSDRSFGYPLFLAIFRRWTSAYGAQAFLLSAFTAQFVCSILGSTLLFFGARTAGLKLPIICYALLLAHPALAGIAAVPLTDSLGCSLACMYIGIVALLCNSQRHLWAKCLALGFLAGVTLSVRPPSTSFMLLWTALVVGLVVWGAFARTRSVISTLKAVCVASLSYVLGFLPVGGHLMHNCYKANKEICVINNAVGTAALSGSLNMSYQYSRAWGTVDPVKSWEWRFTDDKVLKDCSFSGHTPLNSLKTCYRSNLSEVPKHLFHRTIGLFDYRHLNPYAALETTTSEFWLLRFFAAIGLTGLISCILLSFTLLINGKLYQHGYVLLPLSCFAVQVNLHPENRYLLSAIPGFFLFGAASCCGNPFNSKLTHRVCLTMAVVVLAYSLYQVSLWDESALQLFGSR